MLIGILWHVRLNSLLVTYKLYCMQIISECVCVAVWFSKRKETQIIKIGNKGFNAS